MIHAFNWHYVLYLKNIQTEAQLYKNNSKEKRMKVGMIHNSVNDYEYIKKNAFL